jgi:hypothetical protein
MPWMFKAPCAVCHHQRWLNEYMGLLVCGRASCLFRALVLARNHSNG